MTITKQIRKGVFETNSSSSHTLCTSPEAFIENQTGPLVIRLGDYSQDYYPVYTLKGLEMKISYWLSGLFDEIYRVSPEGDEIYTRFAGDNAKILSYVLLKLSELPVLLRFSSFIKRNVGIDLTFVYEGGTNDIFTDNLTNDNMLLGVYRNDEQGLFDFLASPYTSIGINTYGDPDDQDYKVISTYEDYLKYIVDHDNSR